MRSALSRQHSSSSKGPRKSPSFWSLNADKQKPQEQTVYTRRDSPSSSTTPPTSFIDTQFTFTSRTGKAKNRCDSPAPSTTSLSHQTRTTNPLEEHVYAFPRVDSSEDAKIHNPYHSAPRNYLRSRSRTGPSGRAHWDALQDVPALRFSGSSSTYHSSEPLTPDDFRRSEDSLEVMVAAPIAGVETMDALVDGMNDDDDDLMNSRRASGRSRLDMSYHPLYQPPLPTPPPGVVLGGPKTRRQKHTRTRKLSTSTDSSDSDSRHSTAASSTRRRRPLNRPQTAEQRRPQNTRSGSSSTVMPAPPSPTPSSSSKQITPSASMATLSISSTTVRGPSTPPATLRPSTAPSSEFRKSVVPSISEIIRTYAPVEAQARNNFRSSSLYNVNQSRSITLVEEPEPLPALDEPTRQSFDSIADEAQRTLRSHSTVPKPPPAPPSAFMKRHSTAISDNISLYSPRSDPGANASVYSSSTASIYRPHSPIDTTFLSMTKPSASQAVAQYLRSTKLTTLLKLTRQPHASQDRPLTVSLSDLGSPTGFPIIVFLGLGCVRHIMGLYDEMAECLGLRLITIDRWGLGRTESRPKSLKGIIQWASVVEEVLDLLGIQECSVMAHSAGAPYALSFANKCAHRIRGDVCLLAPWVGGTESSGYRWLKYVPNGILKTAQAAEWKIQAWMIGKPPTIAYEGIGYIVPKKIEHQKESSSNSRPSSRAPSLKSRASSLKSKTYGNLGIAQSVAGEPLSRPSIGGSSTFSEYDDLGDFNGKFGSQSTLDGQGNENNSEGGIFVGKRKPSKGFLNRLKSGSIKPEEKEKEKEKPPSTGSKKIKALRSMSSLKGNKSSTSRKSSASPPITSPQLPPSLKIEVNLGLNELNWDKSIELDVSNDVLQLSAATPSASEVNHSPYPRANGRRSVSFTSSKPPASIPSSPVPSTMGTNFASTSEPQNFQAALGSALIAASHAESSKGTHTDLLQILNHDNQPWGFSYAAYPHRVRVWYGDRDEKIAEHAVRWMERTMGDRCSVRLVKGADHGLMYRSSVVVEVLEWLMEAWRAGDRQEPFAGIL
ncbi:hypothetical protein NMY22_g8702 [Coprinellus aureogranulatus]|nr:hypothetical protein NMY22_g8702 [Coprinellus aureogranulatus]